MMGSLGTPVDQPRKLLENARQMCLEMCLWKCLAGNKSGNVSGSGQRVASWEHLETYPGPRNVWKKQAEKSGDN